MPEFTMISRKVRGGSAELTSSGVKGHNAARPALALHISKPRPIHELGQTPRAEETRARGWKVAVGLGIARADSAHSRQHTTELEPV